MAVLSVTDTGRTLKYRVSATVATTTLDPLVDAPNLGEPLRTLMSLALASDAAAGSLLGLPPAAGGIEDNRIRCTIAEVTAQTATHLGNVIAGVRKAVSLVANLTIAASTAAGGDLVVVFSINQDEIGPGQGIVN